MRSNSILGILLLVGGAAAALYGYQRLGSFQAEIGELFGNPDALGIILLAGGIAAVIAGILLLVRRG